MAEFTVTGERTGQHVVSVTWRDGTLSGPDTALLDWITHLAAQLDGTVQGLPGLPKSTSDHLRNPYAACAIIRSVFPGKTTIDQPLPAVETREGAVS